MAENEKANYGGIAAIITAIGGLIAAGAVYYPKSNEPKQIIESSIMSPKAVGDFCSTLNTLIEGISNDFENVKGKQNRDLSTDSLTYFLSKINFPYNTDNFVIRSLNEDGTLDFFTETTLSETKKQAEADIAYQQINRKLADCLSEYSQKEGDDVDEYTIKSTFFRLNEKEINVQLNKLDENEYRVELTVGAHLF